MKIRRGRRVLIGLIVVFAAMGSLCRLALPGWIEGTVTRYLNEKLSSVLGTGISVRSVEVTWPPRQLSLYDVRVAQPEGFGDAPFIYLPRLEIRISLRSLLSRTLEIKHAVLTRAEIHIHNSTNSGSNVQFLADRLRSRPRDTDRKSRLSLHIAVLTATECSVFYFEPLDPQPVEFAVSDIAVQLSDIRIGTPAEVQHAPGHVQATGRLQKLPFPDGRLGIAADIGVISATPPPVNCALRLIGFELGVTAPALPAETAAVLGGDAIDFFVDFSGDATFLNGRAALETIAGYRYAAIISGSLSKPSLDTAGRKLEFLSIRSRGAFGNFLRRAASTGKDAFSSAAEKAGSFGRGLRGTVKGITAFDSSDIRSGIKEMGAALGAGAKDAAATAGGEVKEGAGAIGKEGTGNVPDRQWRDEIPQRWTNAWLNALKTIEQSAFPPVNSGRESANP